MWVPYWYNFAKYGFIGSVTPIIKKSLHAIWPPNKSFQNDYLGRHWGHPNRVKRYISDLIFKLCVHFDLLPLIFEKMDPLMYSQTHVIIGKRYPKHPLLVVNKTPNLYWTPLKKGVFDQNHSNVGYHFPVTSWVWESLYGF